VKPPEKKRSLNGRGVKGLGFQKEVMVGRKNYSSLEPKKKKLEVKSQ